MLLLVNKIGLFAFGFIPKNYPQNDYIDFLLLHNAKIGNDKIWLGDMILLCIIVTFTLQMIINLLLYVNYLHSWCNTF